MKPVARATTLANFLFNAAGGLVFFPFLGPFARVVDGPGRRSRHRGRLAYLIFDLTIGLIFLMTLDWVEPRLRALLTVRAKKETAPS